MMDAASEEYLHELNDRISLALDGNLTGSYLHGSAVLGGYDASRSDLDVLVVVPRSTTAAQRAAVATTLSEESLPCPAAGLELSIVTEAAAAHPDAAAPAFELHMTTAASDSKIVHGRDRDGDPDLLLHLAVCREKGRSLAQPPANGRQDVFGAVPARRIVAQLREELAWAARDAPGHYAVLNASRAWMYAETRQLVSKVAGGEWALRKIQEEVELSEEDAKTRLVKAALQRQNGFEAAMEADDVQRYVDFVLQILEQSGSDQR